METISFSPPNSNPFLKNKSQKTKNPKSTQSSLKITKPQKQENTPSNIKKPPLHEKILKPLQKFFTSKNPPPFLDPSQIFSGNLSPAGEIPATACEVVAGALPPCLDGAYIQNGPNPQFHPKFPYVFADGDGMLHSVKISGGNAVFCSRYVETRKYKIERELGRSIYPNIVAYFCTNLTPSMALTLAKLLVFHNPFVYGLGAANTSLALIGGRLHALMETDLPYQVKITPDGEITTIGRHNFFSTKPYLTMTAHPKVDPTTGEAFAFRYFVVPPFLTFFRINSDGKKTKDVPIFSLKGPSYIHDFAVTQNYAVFPDPQIVMRPLDVLVGRPALKVDSRKVPRVGVIPRGAEDEGEMFWVEEEGLNILHVVNAWEEGRDDLIVVIASNVLAVEHVVERVDLVDMAMEKIVINVKTKRIVARRRLSEKSLDFGSVNPRYAQKRSRYVYAAIIETMPKMVGVVKMDLLSSSTDCTVASRMYGPDCYGSEPIFVAKEGAEEEDDGYLLTYVNNERTQESHFVVMDAKSATLEIVASVKLPRRVPQGFHSIFVKQSDLERL